MTGSTRTSSASLSASSPPPRTGEIQSRIANDVGGVRYVVTDTLSAILSNAVTFLSTLVAMAILSWELTVVSVIAIPVFAVMSRWVGERRREVTEREQEAAAEVTAITQETLSISGIMLSKLFGRQGHEIERFHKQNRRMATLAVRRQMTGQAFFTVMQIFFSVAPVAVYLIAGYLLTGSGELGMTSGTLIAFVTLQFRLYFPIVTLMENSVETQSSMAMFEAHLPILGHRAGYRRQTQRGSRGTARCARPRRLRLRAPHLCPRPMRSY